MAKDNADEPYYKPYYAEMLSFWRDLYDPAPPTDKADDYDSSTHWNKKVIYHPEELNFWFDFIDSEDLYNISVNNIGRRTKIVNDNKA